MITFLSKLHLDPLPPIPTELCILARKIKIHSPRDTQFSSDLVSGNKTGYLPVNNADDLVVQIRNNILWTHVAVMQHQVRTIHSELTTVSEEARRAIILYFGGAWNQPPVIEMATINNADIIAAAV